MFAVTPAAETKIRPFLKSLNLLKFTGTGFAHPKPKINNIIVPIGSRCLTGFRLNLPNHRAVESPILSATQPCASS